MSEPVFPNGKLPHDVLTELIGHYTHTNQRLIVPPGLGEDAAVIDFGDRYLVAKTDPITFATDAVGWYAVHVNANDIAAMGATPRFFLATILLPEGRTTRSMAESIFASIHQAADSLGIAVCGGHTEITYGIDRPIVVGQMLGETTPEQLVRSSGLQPGDALILTKGLGIEATALIAREKSDELIAKGYPEDFITRCSNYLEDPGISVVRDAQIAAQAARLHAMHDPTEGGVATGLFELATASDVGLEIDAEALFISEESARLCSEFALDPLGVISSGALLIGCAAQDANAVIAALEHQNIRAQKIASAKTSDFGLVLNRAGQTATLPQFAADEIIRLFED